MDESVGPHGEAEQHVAGCRRCRAFDEGAWRLRRLARYEVAPPVPDLLPEIMRRVGRELHRPDHRPPPAGPPIKPFPHRRIREIALAVAAGAVVGFVLTAGGLISPRSSSTAALAEEVPKDLVRAAADLQAYRATFHISELDWTRAVPHRTFVARLAFRAPESFSVRVTDTTPYPSDAWPRNDLRLVTDGRTWTVAGPNPCPRAALPACPEAAPMVRSIVRRVPFDAGSPMPTDVIVPMTVLAASDRVDVLGPDEVGGRPAIMVRLTYQDATPLFQYLRFLGSWRPFFPQDSVVVWLDRRTWFPLQYRAFPSPDPERRIWEAQNGLPREAAAQPVFSATATSLSTTPFPSATFRARGAAGAIDEGFHDAAPGAVEGLLAVSPAWTAGLPLWRSGSFPRSDARPFDESVLAFARGLSWITMTRVVGWHRAMPFGVGGFAEQVRLAGRRGVGFYEPASATDPRRVAVHTAAAEFLISSNLPRAVLLRVASTVPALGLPQPPSWRVHRWAGGSVEEGLAPAEVIRRAGFAVLLPRSLPLGHRSATAALARTPAGLGVTFVFRRQVAEPNGTMVTLFQAQGQSLPPPTAPDELVVPLRGTTARWSPDDHLLEWEEGGAYRSLAAPGLDLRAVLAVAQSLHAAGSGR
jgi:hypothetical protein